MRCVKGAEEGRYGELYFRDGNETLRRCMGTICI